MQIFLKNSRSSNLVDPPRPKFPFTTHKKSKPILYYLGKTSWKKLWAEVAADTYVASSSSDNKWSKNGFGQGVIRPQSGKFSKEESKVAVRKAVEDFCAIMKQISVARLCSRETGKVPPQMLALQL